MQKCSIVTASACAALFTTAAIASGATPQMKIVSERHAGSTALVIDTTRSVTKQTTRATVKAGGTTFLAAIALIDQANCVENGPGAWVVKKAPKYGTVSMGMETGPLANGQCPGINFNFATISYTSTAATANHDKMIANWSQAYSGVDYIVIDTFLIKTTK